MATIHTYKAYNLSLCQAIVSAITRCITLNMINQHVCIISLIAFTMSSKANITHSVNIRCISMIILSTSRAVKLF